MSNSRAYTKRSPLFFLKNAQLDPHATYDTDFQVLTLMECVHGPEEDFGYRALFEDVKSFRNKEILWQYISEHGLRYDLEKHARMVHYINLCTPVKVKHLAQVATNRVPSNYCPVCKCLKPCLL